MRTRLMAVILLTSATLVHANFVQIGQITFTGEFTLNHLYNFNDPGYQPFGSFHDQTVSSSNGIFSGVNGVLSGQPLWSVGNLPLFSLPGFEFTTSQVLIAGSDSGRFVSGFGVLSGNSNPDISVSWNFIAPPYDISNFPEDITGPISLSFLAFLDNHHVPDSGSTLALLFLATLTLILASRYTAARSVGHTSG